MTLRVLRKMSEESVKVSRQIYIKDGRDKSNRLFMPEARRGAHT